MKNASWIWYPKSDENHWKYETNEYVDFLFEPELQVIHQDATFHISIDSEYVLWVNGAFVDCGQFDDYPKTKTYDSVLVAKFLKPGKNIIAIQGYYQGESTFQYAKGPRGLCFKLENGNEIFHSDETVKCRISNAFQNGDIQKITPQLGFSFRYDATKDDGWIQNGSAETIGWTSAQTQTITTALQKRPIKKLVISDIVPATIIAQGLIFRETEDATSASLIQNDYLSHKTFHTLFDGEKFFPVTAKYAGERGIYLVVDLGKEQCGYFTLSLDTNEGTVVDIGYGEHLHDLRVRAEVRNKQFANRYLCREGKQEFSYYFKRIAGRYLELHITNARHLHIESVSLYPANYPLEQTGRFVCCDSLHNKIFNVCVDTLKLCMHEHFEDCPWREQALYAYDSRVQALCNYYAFNEFEFAKASLELLAQGAKENGQLNICAPTDETLTIPSFTLMWLLEVKEYTEFSKDNYFIEHYWHLIESMVEAYVSTMENGIVAPPQGDIYWHFYEWSDGFNGSKNHVEALRSTTRFQDGIYHLMAYLAISNAVSLAKSAQKTEFVTTYTSILDTMKTAFDTAFWDDEKQLYASFCSNDELFHYAQLTQALAVYTGICPDFKIRTVCEALIRNRELIPVTLSYSIFKYDALLQYDKAYAKDVINEITEQWGHMLYQGATSFWETIKGSADFEDAGSLCHGWAAVPIYIYLKHIAGITPTGKTDPITDVFPEFLAEATIKDESFSVQNA